MVERNELIRMVTSLQAGNRNAAGELYDHFYEDTYFFIKSMVIEPELSADLAQDTFVEVLDKIHTLQEPAAFVSWLRQIAYHKSINHFKKAKAVTAAEDEDGYSVFDTIEEDRTEFIPHEALDREDLKNTILAMLLELPETQRSALVLHYYEERSVKEISQIQGVSEGTVKSRLNYGRNAIRQSVEAYEKKNGIKLHCAGIAPLLLWLFGQGVLVRNTTVSAGAATATAAASASSAPAAAAAGGAKLSVAVKVLIGAVLSAAAIAGGVGAAMITSHRNSQPAIPPSESSIIFRSDATVSDATKPQETTDPIAEEYSNIPYLWNDWENALIYRKDGQLYCYGLNGAVQLTKAGIPEYCQLNYYDIALSEDQCYLYHPDNLTFEDPTYGSQYRYDLYRRDLSDPGSESVLLARQIDFFEISPDGSRFSYRDFETGDLVICQADGSGSRELGRTRISNPHMVNEVHWNQDMTQAVIVRPADPVADDCSFDLLYWSGDSFYPISENAFPFSYSIWEVFEGDGFYYLLDDNNIYFFNTQTMESHWVRSDTVDDDYIDEKPINYFSPDFYDEYINYDVPISRDKINFTNLPIDRRYFDMLHNIYQDVDGESVCIEANVRHYDEHLGVTVIGKYYPEEIEKVNASEYGNDVFVEVLKRIIATYRFTVKTDVDTLTLDASPMDSVYYTGTFLIHSTGVDKKLATSQDATCTVRLYPVTDGHFGSPVTFEDIIYYEHIFQSPDEYIYSKAGSQPGYVDLYIHGDVVTDVCRNYAIIDDYTILYYNQYDRETGLGNFCIYEDGVHYTLAENTRILKMFYVNEDLVFIAADSADATTGKLCMFRDGIMTELDEGAY